MMPDKDFLLKLDKIKEKEIYAKVTALTFQETPVETIEGRVTTGTINVDGNSAVRRTCSLTIVAQNFNYTNYYWGLNTKFKLEIGVKNNIDPIYDDIIWFPQGIFILTSFNTSRSAANFTITLQGKDKMCLLNGEVGGNIESMVDFGTIEILTDNGYSILEKVPIQEIIRNMIHHYAGEPYYNIIINDLDTYGLELLEYRYDDDLYLYRRADADYMYFDNVLINGDKECSVDGKPSIKKLSDLGPNELDLLVDSLTGTPTPAKVNIENEYYYVAKISFGQTAGYRETDLVYPGDLIANIGESITSVLDKIKNMLSDFEYFYDLDGRFIFQRKQSFINTLWSPIINTENELGKNDNQYVESLAIASSYSYIFNGAELITAFNNNPNLLNMRNDYSVWGTREAIGRQDPVHMRYAIDSKPQYYKTIDGKQYLSDPEAFETMKEQAKQNILNNVWNRIDSFQLEYDIPSGLQRPIKQADGSWSTGWWDIRDWYNYYCALTLEEPHFTMKWYSKNNLEGCIPARLLPGHENASENSYVWLIIYDPDFPGHFNLQHGSGNPDNKPISKILHWSYYDSEGKLHTEVYKDSNGENVKKEFISPYSGCDDRHTYLEFLEGDIKRDGNLVYFYNPDFPNYNSFEELVQDQIDKEYQEYIDSGVLNFADWREIIYQMALDYFAHGNEDDFEIKVRNNNLDYYPNGLTGYEQYYTDLQGFWRYIYNPELKNDIAKLQKKKDEADEKIILLTQEVHTDVQIRNFVDAKKTLDQLDESEIPKNIPFIEDAIRYTDDKLIILSDEPDEYENYIWYQNYLSSLQYYLTTLRSAYNKEEEKSEILRINIEESELELENYYGEEDAHPYWNKSVYEAPEQLNFWFDFLDDNELTGFNVKVVGSRPKVINDTAVKSIYFRETPDVIFVTKETGVGLNPAFKYIQVNDIEGMFSISAQGKSAKDRIDELLYNHGYCIESVTINAIPIYYLQPNTRVYLYDEDSKLNGDYIVSKITIPLTYNGTMTITATKAAENII